MLGKELPRQARVGGALALSPPEPGILPQAGRLPASAPHLLIDVCFGGFWAVSLHPREMFDSGDT